MFLRAVSLTFATLVFGTTRAAAQLADDLSPPPLAARAASSRVQAAPGGGDMVILGPESRYVTRAWRDDGGRVQCGCTREHVTSPALQKSRELR